MRLIGVCVRVYQIYTYLRWACLRLHTSPLREVRVTSLVPGRLRWRRNAVAPPRDSGQELEDG